MTRREFMEITSMYELIEFLDENRILDTTSIYSDDSRNEYIESDIQDMLRHESWTDVLDYLECLDRDCYDFWELDDYSDWHAVTLEDIRTRALEEIDEGCTDFEFDEEETEEDEEMDSVELDTDLFVAMMLSSKECMN